LIYREFERGGRKRFLASDVSTLKTYILSKEDLGTEIKGFEETRLYKALKKPPIKGFSFQDGYVLTIDLCTKPKNKSKKFEKELFDYLANLSETTESPTPVVIAISEAWIKEEEANFNYIKSLEKANKLAITWVNHSKTHPVNDGKFLTAKNVDFAKEVLDVEKILLEKGEIPSVFFRFPGLVSNEELRAELSKLSLIPLDSNAWLAKGEKVKNGSMILIHGNGNEPSGVKMLINQLKKDGNSRLVSIYHN
jgi:hypothetical protein